MTPRSILTATFSLFTESLSNLSEIWSGRLFAVSFFALVALSSIFQGTIESESDSELVLANSTSLTEISAPKDSESLLWATPVVLPTACLCPSPLTVTITSLLSMRCQFVDGSLGSGNVTREAPQAFGPHGRPVSGSPTLLVLGVLLRA